MCSRHIGAAILRTVSYWTKDGTSARFRAREIDMFCGDLSQGCRQKVEVKPAVTPEYASRTRPFFSLFGHVAIFDALPVAVGITKVAELKSVSSIVRFGGLFAGWAFLTALTISSTDSGTDVGRLLIASILGVIGTLVLFGWHGGRGLDGR